MSNEALTHTAFVDDPKLETYYELNVSTYYMDN